MSNEQVAVSARTRLPVLTKMAYGLGTLAFGLKDQGFSLLLMLYYNQVIGLPASWVGATIMAAMVIDAAIDPLIGHWSDNLRSSWGRRHPFMYASALPIALSYLLLWAPPQSSPGWQCAWLLFTAILVRVSVSLFEIPNAALSTEFTDDYEERTSLSIYRGLFLAGGAGIMAIVIFKVFLKPGIDGGAGQLNAAGYIGYSRVAALVMGASVLLSAWGTRRRAQALDPRAAGERASLRDFLPSLREVLFDRAYVSMLLAVFAFALAVGVNTTLGVYLLTYFWKVTATQIGTITGSSVVALILGTLVVVWTKHFDKKHIAVLMMAATIVFCAVPPFLGLLGLLPPDSPHLLAWLIVQNIAVITSILALTILAASMVADVGDHFRLKTGRRIEGLMFSAFVMINKAVSGVGVFVAGTILTLVHFPEKAQPGEVARPILLSLGWVYVASIVVLCLIALGCLRAFPITRASHQDILRRLRQAPASGPVTNGAEYRALRQDG